MQIQRRRGVAWIRSVAVVHRLPTKREAHNERRVNWCSKRGARAACFDKRLIGLQKRAPAAPAGGREARCGPLRGGGSHTDGPAATRVITDDV